MGHFTGRKADDLFKILAFKEEVSSTLLAERSLCTMGGDCSWR